MDFVYEGWSIASLQYFDMHVGDTPIPIEGIGEEAAIVVTPHEGDSRPVGLSLWVRDGNLVMEFDAYNYIKTEGPKYPAMPLDLALAANFEVAALYLEHAGAENLTATTTLMPEGEFTTAPDLCGEFEAQGFDLAADANDLTEKFPSMDRCHWESTETEGDLWLFSEAVGPLGAADLEAEEFAQWWLGGLPVSKNEDLGLAGDESYLHELDPEASDRDDVERPATDFAFRIDNLLFQGRYEGEGDTATIAQGLLDQLGTQAETLLARS